MNEQEQRTIYEWLYEELKGKAWAIEEHHCVGCGFPWREARYQEPSQARTLYTRMTLPPLDMNAWHGTVAPKLLASDVSSIELCSFNVAADFKGHGATIEEACYAALLDYIKGVR